MTEKIIGRKNKYAIIIAKTKCTIFQNEMYKNRIFLRKANHIKNRLSNAVLISVQTPVFSCTKSFVKALF